MQCNVRRNFALVTGGDAFWILSLMVPKPLLYLKIVGNPDSRVDAKIIRV